MIKLKDILLELENEVENVKTFINITSNSNSENPEYTIKLNQDAYDKILLSLDTTSKQILSDKSLAELYRTFESNTIK